METVIENECNFKMVWTQIFVHTQGGSSCGKRMQSKARFAYLLPTTFKCTHTAHKIQWCA